jgi:hypothetical protein
MLNRSLLLGEEKGVSHFEHVVFESACSRQLSESLCQFEISGTSIECQAGEAEKSADACSGAAVKLGGSGGYRDLLHGVRLSSEFTQFSWTRVMRMQKLLCEW